jgi:hypothetical protein
LTPASLLVEAAQLLVTLSTLLGTADKELAAVDVLVVELVDGGLGGLVRDVVDKGKALALALVVLAKSSRDDLAEGLEEVLKAGLVNLGVEVLDEDVGELGTLLLDLGLALLLRDVVADVDLLVVQKHAVDRLDGGLGSLASLVVDKGEAARVAVLVGGDLAREDVAERSERVVEGLCV